MEDAPVEACSAVMRLDEPGVDLRVHDSSWRGVVGLRDAVVRWTARPGTALYVDLRDVDLQRASTYWLSALVSFARIARTRGCRLTVVSPPSQLFDGLTRLRLDVDQPVPGPWTEPPAPG